MTFEEFYYLTLKRDKKRKRPDATNSYNTIDYYSYYTKKRKHNIGRLQYESIIREIHKQIINYFIEDRHFFFPCGMGVIHIKKYTITDIKRRKRKYINWKETIKLWYEDEEAREKKIKILERKKLFVKINYACNNRFHNNIYLLFKANRQLKMKINKMFYNGEYECYG